ncbi:ribulokinase [Pseudogracilibacillus sp. SE30717A]|uniref:ribulokinase n=1 Tax=Pseudogracilibacillus sp. SE30717A TaxID=3098293 RepID=UPI00300DDB1D
MSNKYVIGIDFGTDSGRALLVDTKTGEELAVSVHSYAHGVLDEYLPDGTLLEKDWALQHPNDYLDVLITTVNEVLKLSRVNVEDVIGIGIDFTSCTMLPLDHNGEPLCTQKEYSSRPHSWVKLWKHHAAHKEAEQITAIAKERGENFLARYGGKISSEWMIPKILQIIHEDMEIFEQADLFMEAGDWLVYKLTGNLVRSSNTSGYKAMWSLKEGYPDNDFFKAVHPQLNNIVDTKLRGEVRSVGKKAGGLTPQMAEKIGLKPDTAIAVNIIDAHAAVPAVGAVQPGQFVMAIGTSTCHMLITEQETLVEGVCGTVENGIIPDYISYETGQVAVGDSFSWFVENSVPHHVYQAAVQSNISVHDYLENKAAAISPGETGLIAMDWWNGNRSVLVDPNLSGLILGFDLTTKPEEIYRALIESTAFGTRKVIENYQKNNVIVKEVFACGGIPQKNNLLNQIYADVLNCEIKIADSSEITALGAAMYAATAAGKEKGGFNSINSAAQKMAKVKKETFRPIPENVEVYNKLYQVYQDVHDYYGKYKPELMHELKYLK